MGMYKSNSVVGGEVFVKFKNIGMKEGLIGGSKFSHQLGNVSWFILAMTRNML